jgi:diguanylate cyclase (GGDEF)-like protein
MKSALQVLIVEDSEEDALLLVRRLSQGGYQPQWRRVDTQMDFKAALENQPWDIIFADYTMPRFSGTIALAILRQHDLDVPFIFVSGSIGEDTAVEAMKSGAQDYVMKNNLARLLPAVERELREASRRVEQRRAEQELQLLQTFAATAAAAPDATSAIALTLRKVCETTGWTLAQAWVPSADWTTLECSSAWYGQGNGLEEFRAASLAVTTASVDLPGRVWASKQALWIADVTQDAQFARASVAVETGLRAAVGIPVASDNEVLGVLEFFLREPHAEDAHLLKVLCAVGEQLGGVLQRKRAEERLHYLAHYDALTGLPNRTLFIDRLNQAMADANRRQRLVGVAFLDLDRFKTINDSLGHSVGDLLLKGVADRLSDSVRHGDTVTRLAGDEFTLILADMGHANHAAQVATKILASLARPFAIGGHELFTSASLGMTLYPNDEITVEGLLRNADIAMYRAKKSSGNTYAFYSADMTVRAHERLALENDLRHALDHEQLVVHYQPVIDMRTGAVDTLEALVRWQHPQRGLIAPADFIPLAEESGLIVALGERVLQMACAQFAAFQAACPGLRLAVNVSARQFQRPDLADRIIEILRRTGFDPRLLDLEITESLLMQNMETALVLMRQLSDRGIRFAIDDFGTGYSSLAYLKGLPIERVKIDRSFVRDTPQDGNDVAIVSAIISMAHNLGLQVTAEGVETDEQLALLRERGCNAVQGYLYSRPLPAAEISVRLRQGAPPWDGELEAGTRASPGGRASS